ncbi:MAG: CRISPR-associated endonuclease Cas3'' [Acidilobaceae archaeon]|nr:CRISPR-associated endonuclease Cas3'' [Acidilobaceae archaeon]
MWPVAYDDGRVRVPLADHLTTVALCAMELFPHELSVLERRLSFPAGRALLLAAALHDLGKASRKYDRRGSSGKISFMYHELASAYILYRSAVQESQEERRVFWIAAKVISRHHAAMDDRHPVDIRDMIGSLPDVIDKVSNTIGCLRPGEAENVVSEVMDKLQKRSSQLAYLRNEIGSALQDLKVVRGQLSRIIKPFIMREEMCYQDAGKHGKEELRRDSRLHRDVWQFIDNLARVRDRANGRNYYPIIASLSGALIVADNLVAHYERRTSDDEASENYMRHWQHELRRSGRDVSSLSCLQYVESYVSKPDASALP